MYVAIQNNMDLLSTIIPIGTFNYDSQNSVWKIYRWRVSLFPSQTIVAQFNTKFNSSGPDGWMQVYLQGDYVSFCDYTQIELIRNQYGQCNDFPDPPLPWYCQ